MQDKSSKRLALASSSRKTSTEAYEEVKYAQGKSEKEMEEFGLKN